MKNKLKNILVLYNSPVSDDPADLDTKKSAQGVCDGLNEIGYQATLLGISVHEVDKTKNLTADLVFNLIEWTAKECIYAEEAINNIEAAAVAHTGSNAWGYRLSCDKRLMKQELDKHHIPTAKWQIFETGDEVVKDFIYPVIVKPTAEHCAIGISQKSVVQSASEVKSLARKLIAEYHQPALAEEFMGGDEVQVTVLEKNGQPWVLPPAVIRYRQQENYWPINTYDAKWTEGWEAKMSDWADDLDSATISEIDQVATACYVHLGGRSYPRMDMRLDSAGKVYVLEVNNNAGFDFDPESGIAYSAKKAGLDWHGLLTNVVEEAYASA